MLCLQFHRLPPLHPIILHTLIFLGYPTYRDKTHTYFVRNPLRGISLPFSKGQVSSQGTTTFKMHNLPQTIFLISSKMVKIFLHRVTTHKIQINTNDANFIDSQIITISCIPLQASTRHLTNKRNVHTTTTIFLVALNYLSQVSVSLGHSLAKCPASSQWKHITSDISRGFLVIIQPPGVLIFPFGKSLKQCPEFLHLKHVI